MSSPSPRSVARRRALVPALAVLAAVVLGACGREAPEASAGAPASSAVAADTTSMPTTTTAPTTTTTTEPPTTTTTAQVAGSPVGPGANTLYVLGDSVILGAQSTVPPALVGWDVTFDAKESRRIDQGIGIVQSKGGAVGRVLVVHLCTNWGGGDYGAVADQLLGSLKGVDRVVWITCTPWIPAVGAADDAIRALPSRHPNVVVADWAAWSGSAGFTYSDGLHLQSTGARAMAMLVAAAVGPAPA